MGTRYNKVLTSKVKRFKEGHPKEVPNEIKNKSSSREALDFDVVTREIKQQLVRKGVVKLCDLITAALRKKNVVFWDCNRS